MAPCVWGLRLAGSTDVPVARRACLTALFYGGGTEKRDFIPDAEIRVAQIPWFLDPLTCDGEKSENQKGLRHEAQSGMSAGETHLTELNRIDIVTSLCRRKLEVGG